MDGFLLLVAEGALWDWHGLTGVGNGVKIRDIHRLETSYNFRSEMNATYYVIKVIELILKERILFRMVGENVVFCTTMDRPSR